MAEEIQQIEELKQREQQIEQKKEERINERLSGLPGLVDKPSEDWRGERSFQIAGILIEAGTELIDKLDGSLEIMRKREDWGVEEIFKSRVPTRDNDITVDLDSELKQEGFVEQLSQHDQDLDQAMSTAYNAFDNTNADSISTLHKARADWLMAVRNYETTSRNALMVFNARSAKPSTEIAESCHDAYQEARYYKLTSTISDALLTYVQARANATAALATAFGELISQLSESANDVAVGEATFIGAEQDAFETFWSGLLADLDTQS